jgi:hypothetical protein
MNKKKNKFIVTIAFVFILATTLSAQEYLYPINRDMESRITTFIQEDSTGFHTSMKPYIMGELKRIVPVDSVWQPIVGDAKFYNTWVGRKLRKEHFILVNEDDIILSVDPIFNLQIGRDQEAERNVYMSTRGAMVQGNVNDKFLLYTVS